MLVVALQAAETSDRALRGKESELTGYYRLGSALLHAQLLAEQTHTEISETRLKLSELEAEHARRANDAERRLQEYLIWENGILGVGSQCRIKDAAIDCPPYKGERSHGPPQKGQQESE